MAISKLLIVSVLASLLFLGARGDAGAKEVEHLRSKISSLETSVLDRVRELKNKDETVGRLESIIEEKSASIALLQGEIESIQKRGAVNADELVGRAHVRAGELEKQVEKLKSEIETQNRKRDALEARASEAEKELQVLNSKLETILKTNDEQKQRIRKTERALKVAEEELMRAQLEATSKVKELTEIHGAWLPPWFATHMSYCQDLAKPALNAFLQKAYEKASQAQKWIEPHVETAKTKWIPVAKEQWIISIRYMEPHVRTVFTRLIKFYEVSKSVIAPHIAKAQELADPRFQEVKKFSKVYIDQVALVTKPHVERVRFALKPYTKHVRRAYKKFLKSSSAYHRQVQATVLEKLKKHELTEPLATKELVWFIASALLAIPIFSLFRLLSAIFCKKARKPTQNAHSSHASRRHKRRHADKLSGTQNKAGSLSSDYIQGESLERRQ